MVMIKTRKGDVTISTVILIVLGLAVLVMMIIGFTKGWSFFFDWFDNAPSDLQKIATACALYAQGGLTIDFCAYRMAGDQIINCRDSRIIASLKTENIDTNVTSLRCADANDQNAINACNSLVADENERKTTMINRADGSLATCASLGIVGPPAP